MTGDPIGRRLPVLPGPLDHAGRVSPCQASACRACCFDTEMPLLPDDVARLEAATGRSPEAFSVPDEETGGRRLANSDGHCVFLGPEGCTVYEARPAGCRLYPLVWDPEEGRGMLDEDCPYRSGFRVRPRDRAALMDLVERLQERAT